MYRHSFCSRCGSAAKIKCCPLWSWQHWYVDIAKLVLPADSNPSIASNAAFEINTCNILITSITIVVNTTTIDGTITAGNSRRSTDIVWAQSALLYLYPIFQTVTYFINALSGFLEGWNHRLVLNREYSAERTKTIDRKWYWYLGFIQCIDIHRAYKSM